MSAAVGAACFLAGAFTLAAVSALGDRLKQMTAPPRPELRAYLARLEAEVERVRGLLEEAEAMDAARAGVGSAGYTHPNPEDVRCCR